MTSSRPSHLLEPTPIHHQVKCLLPLPYRASKIPAPEALSDTHTLAAMASLIPALCPRQSTGDRGHGGLQLQPRAWCDWSFPGTPQAGRPAQPAPGLVGVSLEVAGHVLPWDIGRGFRGPLHGHQIE